MRESDWDLICAEHLGQRPSVPHQQAGRMTAHDGEAGITP